MGIKGKLKTLAENITGTHILQELPFGVSIPNDISQKFPDYRFDVIFDIGANVGQSALEYVELYPAANVYCFEPIRETFEQLTQNVAEAKQVHCFNFALGDAAGEGVMSSEGVSTMNCLLPNDSSDAVDADKTEAVKIFALDDFCKENKVDKISYLKIDTEGGDLGVLRGSVDILAANGVDFVEVEAGMNPHNKHHVPFEFLKEFLEGHGYLIFGIYEQVKEWPKNHPNLRRTNTVFISEKMIHA